MSKYDVRARILKTGEERIYPEVVFNNICDDTENPLQFLEFVDLPQDNQPLYTPQSPQIEKQSSTHQQILVDALLNERKEKQELQARIKELESAKVITEEPEKPKRGRPSTKTEEVTA